MRIRGFELVSNKSNDKNVKLPMRSTKVSSGYDFFLNKDEVVIESIWKTIFKNTFTKNKETIKPIFVPTGIKSYMKDDESLLLFNRSSNPKNLGLILANSVAVIDPDYYNNEKNEGEIAFMFYNIFPFDVKLKRGDKIGQGIFIQTLRTDDDNVSDAVRNGGIGSTGK